MDRADCFETAGIFAGNGSKLFHMWSNSSELSPVPNLNYTYLCCPHNNWGYFCHFGYKIFSASNLRTS